ncbi:MAG: hypothetical protein K0U74_01745 [Alphaproteobacteria bacterium]|nr:hypothetical protein [Alphaproteobacteria bacterium]
MRRISILIGCAILLAGAASGTCQEFPKDAFSNASPLAGTYREDLGNGYKTPLPTYDPKAWCEKYETTAPEWHQRQMARINGPCLTREENSLKSLNKAWGMMSEEARGFCEAYLRLQKRQSYNSLMNCVIKANMRAATNPRRRFKVPTPQQEEAAKYTRPEQLFGLPIGNSANSPR